MPCSYVEHLDDAQADDARWYWPKLVQVGAFLYNVSRWISLIGIKATASDPPLKENPDIPITVPQGGERQQEDLKDASLFQQTGHIDTDLESVHSRRSSIKSVSTRRSSVKSTSSPSLHISAEAEKAALIAKAARLQEKHDLEEQEQIFRKRRVWELSTEIEAANAKINYLKGQEGVVHSLVQAKADPEQELVLGAEAGTSQKWKVHSLIHQ